MAAQAMHNASEKVLSSTVGNAKQRQLDEYTITQTSKTPLTTYTGVKVSDTEHSTFAGQRGPAVLNDFHLREKISHFDHERIPERVVHARGAAVHGEFKLHTAIPELSYAGILNDTSRVTPTFVRFSTVMGSRGSADTVRDVRGFATRFFTDEGNWDIVGNNIPIFFVQDAIKFVDLVHAVKPEPHNEIPQAQTAHDNAWDFMALSPESSAMFMWTLSDRAIPRSYRHMQGFGVHSFRLINAEGKSCFVKFHWTPHLGTHSLVWDECLKLGGQDPDFHRRDMWEAIEAGAYPKWELGVQIVKEEDEHKFDFDILDSTKIIPEDMVPVQNIGTMTLNRNTTDYFTETEQVAFCTQHIVPGIDHSNDPLLAGRNFSYQDTQISRIGINFPDIPINRPVCPFSTNHQDGQMQQFSKANRTRYHPNRFDINPVSTPDQGGYIHYAARVAGMLERAHGPKFQEHFNQATLFWNSMSDIEKQHIVSAAQFELGRCEEGEVQQRMIDRFNQIDHQLAIRVAEGFGNVNVPDEIKPNHGQRSEFLSQITGKSQVFTAAGRKIALFVAEGFELEPVLAAQAAFTASKCIPIVVGPVSGPVKSAMGTTINAQFSYETCRSTLFDGLIFFGGKDDSYLSKLKIGRVIHAGREAYMHQKAIGATGNAVQWLSTMVLPGEFSTGVTDRKDVVVENGVVLAPNVGLAVQFIELFTEEAKKHRCWTRDVSHIAA